MNQRLGSSKLDVVDKLKVVLVREIPDRDLALTSDEFVLLDDLLRLLCLELLDCLVDHLVEDGLAGDFVQADGAILAIYFGDGIRDSDVGTFAS